MAATISGHDAFNLLQYQFGQKPEYDGQIKDIITDELNASTILCLSDTTDVLVGPRLPTNSLAIAIERKIDRPIDIVGSDYIDFRYLDSDEPWDAPLFGAHLPQNIGHPRREYVKVDNTQLATDLKEITSDSKERKSFDLILSKNSLCCCNGSHTCGGVPIDKKSQKEYLETLLTRNPDLMVLSGNKVKFETAAQHKNYLLAKENLAEACRELSESSPDYGFRVVDTMNYHDIDKDASPNMEFGYMLVAYKKSAVNFIDKNESLQNLRMSRKSDSLVKVATPTHMITGSGLSVFSSKDTAKDQTPETDKPNKVP